MLKSKQLYEHKPEQGQYGDCFRTAIACLLNLQPGEVPHVYRDGAPAQEALLEMNTWLAKHYRLVFVDVPFDFTLKQVQDWAKSQCFGSHYLLTGTSKIDCGHVVVCKDGEIVWDPSIKDTGIVSPLDGHYWLGLLARIS